MPLALTAYLTSSPSLRAPLYYSTWGLYYASYAVSPGLVTLLQVLILALTWGLPRLEVATARGRVRLASSEWATTQFRDEFVDPNAPPAEWPGWLKTTGNALDVRWVGSSAWEGVSGFFKSVGGWFGGWFGGGKAAAPATTDVALSAFRAPSFRAPSLPAHAASVAPSAFTARPPSHRVATMPAHAAVAPGSASSSLVRDRPFAAASAVGSFSAGGGGGSLRTRSSNPFSVRGHPAEHENDRGSVWSGSGWKKA